LPIAAPGDIFVIFAIDRNHLLRDPFQSIAQLKNAEVGLKKPLKIAFKGEPAVDAGGVQREFFELIANELFDPERGLSSLTTIYIGLIRRQMIHRQDKCSSLQKLCLGSRFSMGIC
jgi:hypothetical protein